MNDLISRQAALITIADYERDSTAPIDYQKIIRELPAAQPEIEIKPISYDDCANAMLKMWMDSIVTDGEYYRIMDKLIEAQEGETT